MIKTNYHTHHWLCKHAEGNIEDYIKQAIELGLEEIGISDHGPIPEGGICGSPMLEFWLQSNMSLKEYKEVYIKELDDAIEKYGHQISIKKGAECEYIPSEHEFYVNLRKDLDYLALGLHFFRYDNQEVQGMFMYELDKEGVLTYGTRAVQAMKTGLFKMFFHPDLYMQTYKNEEGKQGFDETCEKVARMIIETAIKNEIYLEINTNGIRGRKRDNRTKDGSYPNKDFWKVVAEYKDVKVIIGSDAHKPHEIYDNDVKEAISLAKELGIKIQEKIIF